MNNTTQRLGIVIPTFNRREKLKQCLHCLNQQVIDHEMALLTIVVNDGSADGTLEMLREYFPNVYIINGNGNWWYTKCINEGIKKAQHLSCKYLLTLNDDLKFSNDYLNTILKDSFSIGEECVMGSVSLTTDIPQLITFSGVKKIDFFLKEYPYIRKFTSVLTDKLTGVYKSKVLSGRGILYPMTIFEKLGLYDERLVQYSSETDFTYQASKNGYTVLISYNAKVYEDVKLTSGGAIYNNPSFVVFIKSLVNEYSINSIKKVFIFSIKHKGRLLGSFISGIRILGLLKNFIEIKIKR